MTKNADSFALINDLDTFTSRWMLFRAWRLAHTCGQKQCTQDGHHILEALELSPGLTTNAIARILEKPCAHIMAQLKGLEEKGLILIDREAKKKGAKIYLTESGKEQLMHIRSSGAGLASHYLVDESMTPGLVSLTEDELAQALAALTLLLDRQKKVIDGHMFQPTPYASFPI